MTDYRISIEEFENEAMIAEMARSLIREAFSEDTPSERVDESEKIELPF